jgi:predicted nucleic acid-binding protein
MAAIVIDTSALIAVVIDASEKPDLIRMTQDVALTAPSSVHWEVGNAFSAMLRRKRLTHELVVQAIAVYRRIPVRFIDVDLADSLKIASQQGLYAYDAYLVECARAMKAPLLTLDHALGRVASALGIEVLEV